MPCSNPVIIGGRVGLRRRHLRWGCSTFGHSGVVGGLLSGGIVGPVYPHSPAKTATRGGQGLAPHPILCRICPQEIHDHCVSRFVTLSMICFHSSQNPTIFRTMCSPAVLDAERSAANWRSWCAHFAFAGARKPST